MLSASGDDDNDYSSVVWSSDDDDDDDDRVEGVVRPRGSTLVHGFNVSSGGDSGGGDGGGGGGGGGGEGGDGGGGIEMDDLEQPVTALTGMRPTGVRHHHVPRLGTGAGTSPNYRQKRRASIF